MKHVGQNVLTTIRTRTELMSLGFLYANKSRKPEYFTIDGAPGDYAEHVYVNRETGQEVTLVVSREFGIFDVVDGDQRGKLKYS